MVLANTMKYRYIYMYICTHMYVHVHVHVYVYTYVWLCLCICICIYVSTYTYIYIYSYTPSSLRRGSALEIMSHHRGVVCIHFLIFASYHVWGLVVAKHCKHCGMEMPPDQDCNNTSKTCKINMTANVKII